MKSKKFLFATVAVLFAACGSDSKSNDTTPAPAGSPAPAPAPAPAPSKQVDDAAAEIPTAPETTVVKEAIARAKASGKKVVIKVSGAWCPPCQLLSQALDEAKDNAELKSTLARYEFVEVEERHFLNGTLSDFLPFQIQFYPSLVLHDPATGRYSLTLAESSVPDFRQQLEGFARDGSAIPAGYASIESAIANNDFAPLNPLYSLPIAFAVEYPRAEAEAALAKFIAYVKASKAQLVKLGMSAQDVDSVSVDSTDAFYRALLSNGKVSADETEKALADDLATARSDAGSGPYKVKSITFTAPLAQILISKGVAQAAKECSALAKRSETKFAPILDTVPADATAEDKKTIDGANAELVEAFKANVRSYEIVCTTLGARAKTLAPEAALKVVKSFSQADIDAKKVSAHDLARIAALGSDFNQAVQLETQYRDTYILGVTTSLEKSDKAIAAAQKELDAAKVGGDAQAINSAQIKLDGLKNSRRGKELTGLSIPKAIDALIAAYKAKAIHPALVK